MPIETEIKFRGVDFDALRSTLHGLDAEFQSREFESNLVLDDAAGSLRGRDVLLRLREAGGRAVLTLKTPPAGADEAAASRCKRRMETETRVADAAAMRDILAGLGYRVAFAYEKLRETWHVGGVEVLLDTLPFGEFIEIEGAEDELLAVAARLGLDMAQGISCNYHTLHRRHRAELGLPAQDSFVFDNARREALQALQTPPTGREIEP